MTLSSEPSWTPEVERAANAKICFDPKIALWYKVKSLWINGDRET